MAGLTEQQQLAVISGASKILVSAGAGSGKTHVLVERYIERLKRNPALKVNNFIAVTFTRKAANEMRIRLKKRIRELHDQSQGEERQRWAECLAEVDGAKIGTIHSLCETIIKTFPLDAGVDPQLEVLDDLSQARLLEESINAAFREVIEEQSAEHDLMLEFDMLQIRSWLTGVLRSSLQFQEAIADVSCLSKDALHAYAERVCDQARLRAVKALSRDKTLRNALADLRSYSPSDMTASLDQLRLAAILHGTALLTAINPSAAAQYTASLTEVNRDVFTPVEVAVSSVLSSGEVAWQALCELAAIKPGNTGGNKDGAKATRASIKVLRELAANCVEKIPAVLSEVDDKAFECSARFMQLAARAQMIYAHAKKERFCADYNDLIQLALSALQKPASAGRKFYNTMTSEILVDEFQDTNRVQSTLLALLAGAQTTLFLIGDDKQSIYKFQGADVSTFNEWKNKISADDAGALLSLSKSFRSHPHIVDFVNALFSELMGPENAAGLFDATFQSLEAARTTTGGSEAPHVEVVCYSDGAIESTSSRTEQNRRAEAKAVADWVLEKVNGGAIVEEKGGVTRAIKYGDFAVLVQRNKDFSSIESAFIKANIPYVMMGGRNFLERQEIYDVENLLSFLASPLNDHALIGALRSPMFGIGDDLLQGLSSSRASGAGLWNAMQSLAKQRKAGYEPIRRAVILLKQFIADAGRLQLCELVRRIVERTGYDIILLGLPNGKQRSRNLWKLVALALDKQDLSAGEFAESLRLMREYNVQQTDASLDTADSVKLMTIHSSKGLEFPAVILPVLDASSGPRNDRVIYHREYGLAFNTARTDSDPKPAYYQVATAINEEMELAEKKRLFYVATTRARDYLGLFFNPDSRNFPSFRTWLRDWLGVETQDDNAALENKREQLCAITHVEVIDEPIEQIAIDSADEKTRNKLNWDLIWPAMDGEVAAPPPNAGVRVTLGQSRQRLDSAVIGTAFHSLMENLPTDLTPLTDDVLQCVAFAQGDVVADLRFRDELVREAKILMVHFYESELFLALKSARRRFHELPYIIVGDNILSKRPDLIYEDHHGIWHLVDYKTDRFELSEIEQQSQRHAKQLREYVNELRLLTGIDFTPSLYFAQLGKLVSVRSNQSFASMQS